MAVGSSLVGCAGPLYSRMLLNLLRYIPDFAGAVVHSSCLCRLVLSPPRPRWTSSSRLVRTSALRCLTPLAASSVMRECKGSDARSVLSRTIQDRLLPSGQSPGSVVQ